jgi:hypothetical protein
VCWPGVASQPKTHCTQVSTDGWATIRAGRHGPSSTRTSTVDRPRCCAQATPATATMPARSCANGFGVSIRDDVRIGARGAQPRSTQYGAVAANVVSSRSTSHLVAETYPYRPGTIIRTGKPCSIGSGSPFMPTASIASRPSRTTAVGVPIVMPSVDVPTIWSAAACTPASRSSGASAAPSQRAVPTRSPPTSLETQVIVMSRSTSGRPSRDR